MHEEENEESNTLFIFDDNDINELNVYTILYNLPDSVNDLKTITLDKEDALKLQDPILKTEIVIKRLEPKDYILKEDNLIDEIYTNHHKNLRKIEYNDYLLQKYEAKDLVEELNDDLEVLNIDMNINPKSKDYKHQIINSVLRDINTTVSKLCLVHDLEDYEEIMKKKELCIKEVSKMLSHNKFIDFKRSLIIKRKSKKYINEFIKKYDDINKYEPWDRKFIYNDMDDLQDNIDYDCDSEEEEDILLLNLGNVQDIKKYRLEKLYKEHGIKHGKVVMGQQELIIEPFKAPYFKPAKS